MTTINAPTAERRHTPERRLSGNHQTWHLTALDWSAMLLMIVGGINWGLVGIFDMNLVAMLFGVQTPLARLVYVLVALAALYGVYLLSKVAARKT